ncbi:hypothetical protein CP532_5837 [Ophiocordyceps camponoti-leonardi (nom. inval.)]|nr:hypothetical protein CP532_5837 [Ophiocordyceps camponoti-leonardi (nom. inval.)]
MAGIDLYELASFLAANGPHRVLPASRRLRVIFNRVVIVDTTSAVFVWEHDRYPQYYVPATALVGCVVREKRSLEDGKAAVVELSVGSAGGGDKVTTDRVLRFADDPGLGPLANLARLEFGAMDQWLEEDVPIYVHPKDPYKRIDVLPSSRTIEVKIGNETVAKASSSVHLLETGLPARYYISPGAVDPALLRKSSLTTKCPYKGEAEYWHVVLAGGKEEVVENVVWQYRIPTHESSGIAGLLCFYNERVDVFLDGVLQERPKTHFA